MKIALLLGSAFLFLTSLLKAEPEYFRPVVNDIYFTGEVVSFGEAKAKFRPLHQAQPEYPPELLSKRVEGFAVIAFLVELDGTTSQCQVLKASDVAFGEAAKAAIAQWRFSAPEFAGKRGPIVMRLPVDFTLDPVADKVAGKPAAGPSVASR